MSCASPRSLASSCSRRLISSSSRRLFRTRIATARFCCCDRSFWHWTTVPVGRCVIRTAESVLLTCWPPAPCARYVSMRRSFSSMSIATSSSSHGRGRDAREGGVPAVVLVERREAHQPVDALLGLDHAVRVVSLERERGRLDARLLARCRLDQPGLEAALLGPAQVHAQQHLGPVLGVGAAGAGRDLDEGGAAVVLAGEERGLLQRVDLARGRAGRWRPARSAISSSSSASSTIVGRSSSSVREAVEQVELAGQLGPLGAHLAGGAGVVPESGRGDRLVELGDAGAERVGVKGNHGPRRAGPSTPRQRPRDPRVPGWVRRRRARAEGSEAVRPGVRSEPRPQRPQGPGPRSGSDPITASYGV